MKEYLLSLEVWSDELTLVQLTKALGCEPSATSHTIGQIGFKDRIWKNSAWKKEIGTFEDDSLDEAFAGFCKLCDDLSQGISRLMSLSNDVDIFMNIGIMADTALHKRNASLYITRKALGVWHPCFTYDLPS